MAVLDFIKGAIPVGIAYFWLPVQGSDLILIALAPVLGHAYSPWLKFKGGKGVAVTLGVWSGLTIGAAPTILGLFLGIWSLVLQPSSWIVVAAMLSFGVFVLQQSAWTASLFVLTWLGHFILLLWTHRHELNTLPRLRPWTRETG